MSTAGTSITLRSELEGAAFRDAVARVLPKILTPERFVRVACTAMTRTPKLRECDRASFFSAMLALAQTGLEPDGRRAHLIPFENRKRGIVECQLIIDYKGLVDLAYRSGLVQSLHADVVCENDVFRYSMGEVAEHSIDFRKGRGKVYAVYARAVLKSGRTKCEVLSAEEVDGIKARSRSSKNGPWITDWNEMAKKTAFRRLSKWLPLSSEFREAVDRDEDAPEELKDATASRAPYNEEANARAKAIIDASPRVEAVDTEIAAQEAREIAKGE